MESMSKKEKLGQHLLPSTPDVIENSEGIIFVETMVSGKITARGSAVIKVMKVIPRSGHYMSAYVDVHKLPKKPKGPDTPRGVLADMPWLNVKAARFAVNPKDARIDPTYTMFDGPPGDPCEVPKEEEEDVTRGLPDGHKMIRWFGYREWISVVHPLEDGQIADHFNILLGLLISMSIDPENENFPDIEAFPCIQFLRTIKTPDGEVPFNVGSFIGYIEYICQKVLDEG